MKFTLYLTVLFVVLQVCSLVHAATSYNLMPEAHILAKRDARRGYHRGMNRSPSRPKGGLNLTGIGPLLGIFKGFFVGSLFISLVTG